MLPTRHIAIPASYLLLRRNDEILLMLRQNTGYYDGWYSMPSGHVERGELPMEALIRETKEEIGIDINRAHIRPVHVMYRTRCSNPEEYDRVDYFFEVREWTGEPTNTEPHKCSALQWSSMRDLPTNTMHHVRDAIDAIMRGETYTELGAEKVHTNPSIKSL